MKKILLYTAIALFITPMAAKAQFETSRDSVVQLYGVIMTADSLVGIPAVSVMVNKNAKNPHDHRRSRAT